MMNAAALDETALWIGGRKGLQYTLERAALPAHLGNGGKMNEGGDAVTQPWSVENGSGRAPSWRTRIRRACDALFCRLVGRSLNGSTRLPYDLGRRPEFHWSGKGMPQYAELYRMWTKENEENAWDLARFYAIYQNAAQVLNEGLPGDIVELGVYRGNSAAILAGLARGKSRRLFLFDTFTGFDERDFRGLDSHRRPGFENVSLERVKQLVGTQDVFFVPGYFPESCAQIELPREIVLAHLDCDLYEPTKAGLELFYPRVVPGGMIIVHDYSSGFWPGITKAVDEFFADRSERPILIPDRSGSVMIRKMKGSAKDSAQP
jgi:O-methyltransferase